VGHILLVDDDDIILELLQRELSNFGHRVDAFPNALAAIGCLQWGVYDAIITDISMPEMDGIDFLRHVRAHDCDVPVILITGGPDLESAVTALEYGAFRYLIKPFGIEDLNEVVERAVRLYALVRLRREALEIYQGQEVFSRDRPLLEKRFERALDSLWVAFQPIVSVFNKNLYGYEALVRSQEPQMSLPKDILQAARALSRIGDLGRRIRGKVSSLAPSSPASSYLFVNVDIEDLMDNELYSRQAPLAKIANRVILEITEHSSLTGIPDIRGRMEELREIGFRIAVDDLGAGYSGLSNITQLEPEVVKLDMGLIRDVHNFSIKQRVIGSILNLCTDLDIEVISEGVETKPEFDMLSQLGCDLLQGFFFAQPEQNFSETVWRF